MKTLDAAAVLQHAGLVDWLAGGERGMSSNTIVQELTGIPAVPGPWGGAHYHPLDPDDFRRCERLLRQVPTLRPLMPRMAALSPVWSALVAHWGDVVQLMEHEVPGCFGAVPPDRSCPRAYRYMKELGC